MGGWQLEQLTVHSNNSLTHSLTDNRDTTGLGGCAKAALRTHTDTLFNCELPKANRQKCEHVDQHFNEEHNQTKSTLLYGTSRVSFQPHTRSGVVITVPPQLIHSISLTEQWQPQ